MKSVPQSLFFNNSTPSISVMNVTPDLAREWLASNIGNRPLYQAHIKSIEADIKAGKWKMTGDPIRFSKTGKLIDGQHRLHAILNSGVSVVCVVMHALDDDIFDVLDSGKARNKTDVLFIELGLPKETCGVLSSCVGLAIDYEREQYSFSVKANKRDLLDFVAANPAVIDSAIYGQALSRATPVPRSIGAFFHFYAAKKNRVDAERFLERFMVGAVDGSSDNLLALRNLALHQRAQRRTLSRHETIWRLVKIWNAEQRNAPIKHFGNTGIRQDEKFPRFI